jgi:hypothetical protein
VDKTTISLSDFQASMNPDDFMHAITDRPAWDKSFADAFSRDRLVIDTPYMRVLQEQLFANVSKIEANDYYEQNEKFVASINNLLSSFEKNLAVYMAQNTDRANRRGRLTLRNDIIDCARMISHRSRAYIEFNKSWEAKIKSLIDYYNLRTAKYVDLLTIGKDIVVEYPIIELSTVSETFAAGVERATEIRDQTIQAAKRLIADVDFEIGMEW